MNHNLKQVLSVSGHRVLERKSFEGDGTDFNAYHQASAWIKQQGYTQGSMCRNKPIAAAKEVGYIAKWDNIPKTDYPLIEAMLISNDFRFGNVDVVILGE